MTKLNPQTPPMQYAAPGELPPQTFAPPAGGFVSDKKGRPWQSIISICLTVLTLGYMLPWMVASLRGKSNTGAIGLLNLLLGWTFIGWIVALVMACGTHQKAFVQRY